MFPNRDSVDPHGLICAADHRLDVAHIERFVDDAMSAEAAARRAADTVRAGGGPVFLECRTYRFRAHSMFDAELYRDKAEVEEWKQRDPIVLLRAKLEAAGVLADGVVAATAAAVEKEIAQAAAFAESGTWEPVDQLTRDVYTPGEVTSGAR
jgi:TPP-dependent pyruvate/acetoin dehydrogenase alpha subunit